MAGVRPNMSTSFKMASQRSSSKPSPCTSVTDDRPRAWVDWLASAEYCYNTALYTNLRTSSFKVVYRREPPALLPFTSGSTRTDTVETMLQERDAFLVEVRKRLLQAQQLARKYYDANHRELTFKVCDYGVSASSSFATLGRTKCWPRWAPSRIVFTYRMVRACMTSFMLGCSSHSVVTLRQHCCPSRVDAPCLFRNRRSAANYVVSTGSSWSSGQAWTLTMPPRSTWSTSSWSTRSFSSRTSYFRRTAEML